DLEHYDLLVAPMLYMVKPGLAERIEALVTRGGRFVAGVFSGVADETDLAFAGAPGPLGRVLGIRVEEIDALPEGHSNRIVMEDGTSYSCGRLCEIIHCEGARALATYGEDFYAGGPVLTAHAFGRGHAYYIASDPAQQFLDDFYGRLLAELEIAPLLDAPAGVEVALRVAAGRSLLFVLNHTPAPVLVPLPAGQRFHEHLADHSASDAIELPGYGVAILESK
ncbi:MAG TPA: beta-galactosidase trimerization domain-containing protein, partial [Roseiflexaceae bacterium]|nr:beta-galactosidase trimerization domain-containing protein [Roseiflexaceae bacterium]